jgi:hypothetical protein
MPNHCENDLYISGNAEDIAALLKHIGADQDPPQFDFNTIVPYPEKLKQMDDESHAIHERLREFRDLHGMEYGKKHEELFKDYIAKWGTGNDGYNNGGYEWCLENWGTKWGAYDACRRDYNREYSNHVCLTFRTAWSPPAIDILKKLHILFPAVSLNLEYFECGMGYCGGVSFLSKEDAYDDDWEPGTPVNEWRLKGYRGSRGG